MRLLFPAFGWTMVLAIVVGCFPPLLAAEEYDEIKVSAKIVAGSAPDKALLKITAKLLDDWHIYSTTQLDGGPTRTRITLKSSPLFKTGGPFTPDHEPEVKVLPEFPGVPSEEHAEQVTWTTELQLSPGVKLAEVAVAGKLSGQVCTTGGACVPINIDFAALGAGDIAPANPLAAPPEAKAAPVAAPQGEAVFSNRNGSLAIRGEIRPAMVAPGGKAELRFTAKPGEGYHVYAWAARDPDKSAKPTLIVVTEAGKLKFGAPQTDSEVHTKPAVEADEPEIRFHEGAVTWTLSVEIPADAKSGEIEVAGLFGAQVCTDKTCDQPEGARFTGKLMIGEAKEGSTALLFVKAKYKDVGKAAATQTAAAPGEPGSGDVANGSLFKAEESLGFVLAVAFFGGFILNFMPCVLPVVGLKLLSFAKQAGQSRAQAFALNFSYAVGQLSIFMILAIAAVTLKLGWGQQFSNVAFVVGLTGFMFALSLSFLGVWEMPIPGLGNEDQVNELAAEDGLKGAFFQGILTTILSTPCSGPMLGFVFGVCLTEPPYVTFLVFTVMSIGMSLPYLVIGLEPSLIRFLPKPGEWMNTLKSVLGFMMLGGVAAMVSFLKTDYWLATLEILVLIGVACWMIGKIPAGSSMNESWPTWTGATSIVAIGAALSFFLLGPSGIKIEWREYSPPLATQLQKQGQTVMVDFTANWCPTCRTNKRWVIETSEVADLIKKNGIVPVLADWTDGSDEIKQHLNLLKANSIPLLAIYPAGKPGEVILLRDVISQSQLIEALQKAGPSKAATAAKQGENAVVMSEPSE